MVSSAFPGGPDVGVGDLHHLRRQICSGRGLVELSSQLLVFPAKVEQGLLALGEDGFGPPGVDKIGEECMQ